MLNRISDLEVGKVYDLPLVVTSATARNTKAGKPYLQLEFFDGVETIGGNYWDWSGNKIPEVNTILNVKCQVTTWQGTKQLNISGITTCTDHILAEFAPTSRHDLAAIYKEAYSLACSIQNDVLRTITVGAMEELQVRWLEVPGARTIHHAYIGGTLVHCVSVANIAASIAKSIPEANLDLCIAGGLLHDIGKLFTYKVSGIAVEMTTEGMLFDHLFIGANFIGNFAESHCDLDDYANNRTVQLLQHVILSHHGMLEHGAVVTPQCIEAYIVWHADSLDAATEQIRTESAKLSEAMWTGRIFTLNNRPHLTTQYVGDLLRPEVEESDSSQE